MYLSIYITSTGIMLDKMFKLSIIIYYYISFYSFHRFCKTKFGDNWLLITIIKYGIQVYYDGCLYMFNSS